MTRTFLLDSLLLVSLASILILPLFRLEYMDNWQSIESTFISDAHMLENHLPHPGWQPLWYCGTRFDYIYPPALRYGTALIAKVGTLSTARGYHLYTAVLYVFGIAGIYWMVRIGSGSRMSGLIASIASALLSPSFLFLRATRQDSLHWVPQRLHVLVRYGEGPHISALSILPFALAASFLALRRWRPVALAAAAVLCAFTVASNFYGATVLAILFPAAVWAVWVAERNWHVWARAALIVVLAYGLCAFWLTPSYISITLTDLKYVSKPGTMAPRVYGLILLSLFCLISLRLANRRPDREWATFVAGTCAVLSFAVLGFYYFGFRVTGESGRLIPEWDLALILVLALAITMAANRPRWRIPAAFIVLLAFVPALRYLRHAWSPFPKAAPLESVYDYQMTRWIHDHIRPSVFFPWAPCVSGTTHGSITRRPTVARVRAS